MLNVRIDGEALISQNDATKGLLKPYQTAAGNLLNELGKKTFEPFKKMISQKLIENN